MSNPGSITIGPDLVWAAIHALEWQADYLTEQAEHDENEVTRQELLTGASEAALAADDIRELAGIEVEDATTAR